MFGVQYFEMFGSTFILVFNHSFHIEFPHAILVHFDKPFTKHIKVLIIAADGLMEEARLIWSNHSCDLLGVILFVYFKKN